MSDSTLLLYCQPLLIMFYLLDNFTESRTGGRRITGESPEFGAYMSAWLALPVPFFTYLQYRSDHANHNGTTHHIHTGHTTVQSWCQPKPAHSANSWCSRGKAGAWNHVWSLCIWLHLARRIRTPYRLCGVLRVHFPFKGAQQSHIITAQTTYIRASKALG